jgi:hypothetical protein
MSRLSQITSGDMLKSYAQGLAQSSVQPIADFLAPTVPVPLSVGRYKVYSEKNRFRIPKTLRGIGGEATKIRFTSSDATYNCEAHALDYPIDNLEKLEAEGMEDMLKEGAVAIAEIASLAHEQRVINDALSALTPGAVAKTWNAAADPVNDLDTYILSIIKACGYGSLMDVGVLFGANAWRIFKNQDKVRGRIIVGAGAKPTLATPTEETCGALLLGNPDVKTSYMVHDTAPEGKPASLDFLLDSKVIVFARKKQPTRRDPSFMKTFRLSNKFMVPGSYPLEDGRGEVAKFDWSEDVVVTNTSAAQLLTISV